MFCSVLSCLGALFLLWPPGDAPPGLDSAQCSLAQWKTLYVCAVHRAKIAPSASEALTSVADIPGLSTMHMVAGLKWFLINSGSDARANDYTPRLAIEPRLQMYFEDKAVTAKYDVFSDICM